MDPRINCSHEGIRSVVRYTKRSTAITGGEQKGSTENIRYYISSLEFSEDNAHQILWSVLDYRGIEQHHSRLDDPRVFNQDAIQSDSIEYLGNMHCFNKAAYNILSWIRLKMCLEEGKKRPNLTALSSKSQTENGSAKCWSTCLSTTQYLKT